MLTFEDCLAFAELSEAEINAIAQHERLPELAALELGNYLLHTPDGLPRIRRIILDDIESAEAAGNPQRVLLLKATLHHFAETHPDRSSAV